MEASTSNRGGAWERKGGGDCGVNELSYLVGNGGDMAFGSGEKGGGPLVRGWRDLLRKRMS